MRGLALTIVAAIPLCAIAIVGAVKLTDAAHRGALPTLPQVWGER